METNMTMKTVISKRVNTTARKFVIGLVYLALAGLCAVALTPTPASAGTYDFVGRWMNSDRDSSGITGMVISPNRNGLDIRVFGLCRNQPVCDWNVTQGRLYSSRDRNFGDGNWGGGNWGGFNWGVGNWSRDTDVVTANIDTGYARKFLVLRRAGGNELRVQVFTDSRDRYGRGGYVTESRFQSWGRMSGFDSNRGRDRGPDNRYPQQGPDQQ
jgi:hypothetical protein